jgi:hypothetical protein
MCVARWFYGEGANSSYLVQSAPLQHCLPFGGVELGGASSRVCDGEVGVAPAKAYQAGLVF